nr:MAG TPA: Nucleotide modification associated domain 5 [Caudoviricetes sp.]
MRITKTIAENVAEELTKKLDEKIKEHKKDLEKVAGNIYVKSLPKGLMEAYDKFPKYFNTRCSIQLVGNGANYETIWLDKEYPSVEYRYTASEKDTKSILGRYDTIKKLEKEKKDLETNIQEALLALKTYKRVEQEFPEAVQYLPESSSCIAIAIPMKDLRGKINSL